MSTPLLPQTLDSCDVALALAVATFRQAVTDGDLAAAASAQRYIDRLLEDRHRLAQQ